MIISQLNSIVISGVSTAVPTRQIPVSSYSEVFGDEVVQKFSEMTGVVSVHRAVDKQCASDLAFIAAEDVITKSEIDRGKIGLIIFVTQKPDFRAPSSAFSLHRRLGLSKSCGCFDINLACSGYIFALHTAMSSLLNSTFDYALVMTGDTSARSISPYDRSMIMLFGDSGTATLIKKNDQEVPATNYFGFRTDGNRFKAIITPAGAYRNMGLPKEPAVWSDEITRSDYDTHMKGMDVFGFSITDVPKLMKDLMSAFQSDVNSYDYFALHQANHYILKQIARKIKIPEDKLLISLDRYGNNSSNSVPLVLCDHFGDIADREYRYFISGFGGGLSWACADVVVHTKNINPIIFSDQYLEV